jgi:hypothetical protein
VCACGSGSLGNPNYMQSINPGLVKEIRHVLKVHEYSSMHQKADEFFKIISYSTNFSSEHIIKQEELFIS